MKLSIQLFTLIFLLAGYQGYAQRTIAIGSTIVEVDTVYTGLDVPWEVLYGPDASLWVTERDGIVSRISPADGSKTVILDLRSVVYQQSESGLLGMALHPNFQATPEVFLVYTYRDGSNTRERLVKYDYANDTLTNPDTLLDNIPGNSTHDGSRLIFLSDNTLLMTTGDAQNQSSPQNMSSLNGKVLRLNTDGSIPSDNPFSNSYVYSLGHRNAQGLWRAPSGNIYLSEHGPDSDDEFQLLLPGRNYGWPNVKGFCNDPSETSFCSSNNVAEPIAAWTPTIAPGDIVYYENSTFPEWDSCILMTVLKDKKLIALKLNSNGTSLVSQSHYLSNMFGRLRDICVGPAGEIFIATNGADWSNTDPNTHSIIRLKVQNTTSLNPLQAKHDITVYPNPAKGFVDITAPGASYTAELVDIYGRVCLVNHHLTGNTRLWFNNLPAGMYTVRIHRPGMETVQVKIAVEG